MVSKMANTSPPLTQKVATGLKNVMNRVNFSMHLIHPLRNTALCAYPLSSQRHLKSSVKKWVRFFLVSLAHFPVQMMLKCKDPQKNVNDIHLLGTVQRTYQAGLKFNPNKCCIKKQEIEYFGRMFTPLGVKPCPKKDKNIAMLAAPKDKQELQSLLGTVNLMSTFIPNLTKKTHLMRSLLKRDVHFLWTSDMQKEPDTIKNEIANAVQLTHYEPNKSAVTETNASLKGLSAVLIQDSKPVRFLSKALTPAEPNYSNIERELLAVLFACEKLHTYTFGRKTTVHTDHKPLQNILLKPISLAPARLQRMLLRLSKYDIQVVYVGSKSVLLADTLSRVVEQGSAREIPGLEISIAQVLKVEPTRLESLQEDTKPTHFG